MVMTEARPEVGIIGPVMEVRCVLLRMKRGERVKCNRMLLRLTPDLMKVVEEFHAEHGQSIAWWCDKCDQPAQVETRLT